MVVCWTPSLIYTHRAVAGNKCDDQDKDHLHEPHSRHKILQSSMIAVGKMLPDRKDINCILLPSFSKENISSFFALLHNSVHLLLLLLLPHYCLNKDVKDSSGAYPIAATSHMDIGRVYISSSRLSCSNVY